MSAASKLLALASNVKHWHGAAPDSWFQHIALEVPGTETRNQP